LHAAVEKSERAAYLARKRKDMYEVKLQGGTCTEKERSTVAPPLEKD